MPKTICLVRHAQALHNIDTPKWLHLRDPELSTEGFRQCQVLREHLQKQSWTNDIELIVTSPMRRTLDTTAATLDWLVQKGVPVVPLALWQENSSKPCDRGTELSTLVQEYPNLDFSTVDPAYPDKSGVYAYTEEDVVRRGAAAIAWLRTRPESVIAVVTHSAFLRTSVAHRRFANADFRLFTLADEGDNPKLIESGITEGKGGMGASRAGWMGIEPGDFDESL